MAFTEEMVDAMQKQDETAKEAARTWKEVSQNGPLQKRMLDWLWEYRDLVIEMANQQYKVAEDSTCAEKKIDEISKQRMAKVLEEGKAGSPAPASHCQENTSLGVFHGSGAGHCQENAL